MAKYSEKFKLKIVKEYLGGTLGYNLLAKKYGISAESQVKRWVRAYKEFGEDGLRRKGSKQVYPVKFKLDVLNFMKQTGASYQDAAIVFKMNNPPLITSWYKTFLEKGFEGLQEKPKGRPSMSKKDKAKSLKQEKELSREQQLERENELLRLEIAYLKKLKAFQENQNVFLEKHKQRWHSNSKKKDSN
ncbi:helix-turn-helix domain-containing protein [Caldalkalibacillus mannanilyticus]|uniref:helix-turn-helix domain-containing protein n=1 Tax=Caldalkalibacillus mannanilyticus TaxID=1418 RepID=UPI00046B06CB|nr:helix-turn-helix domain-containing protein [Caldalkalibacillus mannanilyticus]